MFIALASGAAVVMALVAAPQHTPATAITPGEFPAVQLQVALSTEITALTDIAVPPGVTDFPSTPTDVTQPDTPTVLDLTTAIVDVAVSFGVLLLFALVDIVASPLRLAALPIAASAANCRNLVCTLFFAPFAPLITIADFLLLSPYQPVHQKPARLIVRHSSA